ncbi:MAG: FHA domain-containing protein [Labilithrix sp.]|nr:FHA domain-containing protein [Labilithrix sp.]
MSSPTPPPSPPVSARRPNVGTMLPTDLVAWRDRALRVAPSAGDAYAIAVRANAEREPAEPGYRLYWMTRGLLASAEVPAASTGHVVIGRHEKCDVVLDDERAVSLRHVLVRSAVLDDGCPTLSVLDLRTHDGFELSDGTKQHAIMASGPVVFRIGSHTVVALPSTGRIPEALPSPLVERFERDPGAGRGHEVKIQPAPADRGPISRVTLMRGTIDLAERRSFPPGFTGEWSPDPAHPFELLLTMGGFRAVVRFTVADLEQGVLIGRAEKCVDAGLRPILAESISRVHLLLVREKGQQFLYDTASTNGTEIDGRRVRCAPLADEGTTARIAGKSGLSLHWRAVHALQ